MNVADGPTVEVNLCAIFPIPQHMRLVALVLQGLAAVFRYVGQWSPGRSSIAAPAVSKPKFEPDWPSCCRIIVGKDWYYIYSDTRLIRLPAYRCTQLCTN